MCSRVAVAGSRDVSARPRHSTGALVRSTLVLRTCRWCFEEAATEQHHNSLMHQQRDRRRSIGLVRMAEKDINAGLLHRGGCCPIAAPLHQLVLCTMGDRSSSRNLQRGLITTVRHSRCCAGGVHCRFGNDCTRACHKNVLPALMCSRTHRNTERGCFVVEAHCPALEKTLKQVEGGTAADMR